MKTISVLFSLLSLTVYCKERVEYNYLIQDNCKTAMVFNCSIFCEPSSFDCFGKICDRWEINIGGKPVSHNICFESGFGALGRTAFESFLPKSKSAWDLVTNIVIAGDSKVMQSVGSQMEMSISKFNGIHNLDFGLRTNCSASIASKAMKALEPSSSFDSAQSLPGDWGYLYYRQHTLAPDEPIDVEFKDVYFTPLKFLRRKVRCRGVIKRISGQDAELANLWSQEYSSDLTVIPYLCHNRFVVGLEFDRDGIGGEVRQDSSGYPVEVEGYVDIFNPCDFVRGRGMLLYNRPYLKCCKVPKVSSHANGSKQAPICRSQYSSPCREFKIHVPYGDGKYYIVHCYSASIRLIKVASPNDVTRCMALLYSVHSKDGYYMGEEWMRKIWGKLKELENILPSRLGNGIRHGMCEANRFSDIKELQLSENECPGIVPLIESIFALINKASDYGLKSACLYR